MPVTHPDPSEAAPTIAAEYVVPEPDPGLRIDAYVAERLGVPTRKQAKKLIKAGRILLNGQAVETSRFLHPGDRITLLRPPEPPRAYERELVIAHQDPHLAVVVKPSGLPTRGNAFRTFAQALPFNLPDTPLPDALLMPQPVHRLDNRVSGLVMVARTATAQAKLGRMFQERRIRKTYRAVVNGRLQGEGAVELPIETRAALTRWRAVEHTPSLHVGWVTTVECWPETGRTHQIRIHLASLGHPILGDDLYTKGDWKLMRGAGLFLAAVGLEFEHPMTSEPMHITHPEPPKFASYRAREGRRAGRTGAGQQSAGQG